MDTCQYELNLHNVQCVICSKIRNEGIMESYSKSGAENKYF